MIETIEEALQKMEQLILATHSILIKVEEYESHHGVTRKLSKQAQFATSLLLTKILFREYWETLPHDQAGCEQVAFQNTQALWEALHETFLKFNFDSKKLAKELYWVQEVSDEK